ncbi:MAG: Rieske 2Fe-2S domain-containing protein [Burkholderiales bacterium]
MARLFREYWIPATPAALLVADAAPVRVRLFGENYVAFRATDGTLGFLDEACPHRGASLALARNENNSLRCIYHAWQFDIAGRVLDAPCEGANPRLQAFLDSVSANAYPVREAGGMAWVYLGQRKAPPPFPLFEFNSLPANQVHTRRAVLNYNWLQGLEAHLDAAHLGVLHSSTVVGGGSNDRDVDLAVKNLAPKMEMDDTAYGMREAALRDMPDGIVYARMRQLILPCFTMVPTAPGSPLSGRAIVPIDDEHTAEWYFIYRTDGPITEAEIHRLWKGSDPNVGNFAANLGTIDQMWHQDREAMKTGHWTGLTRNVPFEDFIVSASMGVRNDRGREHLGASDAVLVHARKALLDAIESFEKSGEPPWQTGFDYASIRATTQRLPKGEDWRGVIR